MRRAPYIAAGCVAGCSAAFLSPDRAKRLPSEYVAHTPNEWRYAFASERIAACRNGSECTPLTLDEASRRCTVSSPLSALHLLKEICLRAYGLEHYEVSGTLDAPATHMLSTHQWRSLLGRSSDGAAQGRALDVGAGCGFITATIAPLFEQMCATEIYEVLKPRLVSRGFAAAITHLPSDTAALEQAGLPTSDYDVVLALNVLDRVPRADAFLASLISLLAPGGKLVLSLPLPHKHINTTPSALPTTDDALPVTGDTWEAAADAVCRHLERSGLRVLRVARAPYLSQGASAFGMHESTPFVLDAAVIVCAKQAR